MIHKWIYCLATCLATCVVTEGSQENVILGNKCRIDKQQKSVDCSHRGFSKIPNSTFPTNTRKIDLSWNHIFKVKNFTFTGVGKLQVLDLSSNKITNLEPKAFEGLDKLQFLNLFNNSFKLIPRIFSPTLFQPLKHLQTLRLQMYGSTDPYDWRGIDEGFAMLSNIQELFMDFPAEFTFEDGFAKLTKLRTISTIGVSTNMCTILHLSNETFKVFVNTSLRELRLTDCSIAEAETGTFLPLRDLKILDLSHNKDFGLKNALKSLYGLQHRNMEEIHLSQMNNFLIPDLENSFQLWENDMIYLKNICVRCIDISKNFISLIADGEDFGKSECLEMISMPLLNMRYPPIRVIRAIPMYKRLNFIDIGGMWNAPIFTSGYKPKVSVCQTSHDRRTEGHALTRETSVFNRLTSSKNASYLTLRANNFLQWKYLALPAISNITNLKTLDISYGNIDQCQMSLHKMETITHLDISGLLCSQFHDFLTHFPRLQQLVVTNAPNLYIGLGDLNATGDNFQSLHDLQEIDLSGNKLAGLNNNLFISNPNLRSISLSNNKLQRVPFAVLQLENINRLDLSLNSFTHFTAEEMSRVDHFAAAQHNQSRFQLSLRLNPLQCTCETLDFIRWIYDAEFDLDLPDSSSCVLANGSRVTLATFKIHLRDVSVSCVSNTWLIIGVVSVLLASFIILLFYAVYRYRVNLRYWFYTKLQPPVEMLVQKEYVYDAFVAYCEEDYQWIYNDVREALENGENPLKLCFHNRDFTPGKPIHENIVDKMRQSRKIMLSISADFLSSTYGPLEIEYAGMKSLEEGREDIVICVLLADIPVRQMPKVLRNLWHKITFLKWSGDACEQLHFWKQLRDAITDTHE